MSRFSSRAKTALMRALFPNRRGERRNTFWPSARSRSKVADSCSRSIKDSGERISPKTKGFSLFPPLAGGLPPLCAPQRCVTYTLECAPHNCVHHSRTRGGWQEGGLRHRERRALRRRHQFPCCEILSEQRSSRMRGRPSGASRARSSTPYSSACGARSPDCPPLSRRRRALVTNCFGSYVPNTVTYVPP
jgi:hypothetical protein